MLTRLVQLDLNAHLRIAQRLPNTASTTPVIGEPEHILQTVNALINLVAVFAST
ncbi:MAG: hypothetical protein ACYC6H_07245 [Bellilinea sp.]